MAFCPYCGKQIEDGGVCACTLSGVAGNGVAGPRLPDNFIPQTTPVRPSAPVSSAADEQPAVSYPSPPPPASQNRPYIPDVAEAFSQKQDDAPVMHNDPPISASQSHSGSEPNSYAPQKPVSSLAEIMNPLWERIKLLVSSKPEEAVSRAIRTTDMSWGIVYGIYILLGSFASAFAVPRLLTGFFGRYATYGDMLGVLFGPMLWRSLLINLFSLASALGVVMAACGITKTRLPFARALNFVSMAFVPAALLNLPGLLVSFFFPAGTLVCGLLSAVCTIVILCAGLASLVEKKNLWLHVICASVLVLVYALLLYLFTNGVFSEVIGNLASNAVWY